MRSKLAREEEEENSEMNDTKACLPKPKEKVYALQEYMDNFFSDSLRKHIIGGAAGSHPKDMLLSHLQNKFVSIITPKMSILKQIRISNKIWQINQDWLSKQKISSCVSRRDRNLRLFFLISL
jgi:hypothetical protein